MNDRPARKVFVQTHGCQMNEYDSARMLDLLRESHGLQATDNADEADVLLLNTCSIREKAQEKVFHQLGRWRKLKQERPGLVIGVGGCVASRKAATSAGAPLRGPRVRPADPAPAARDARHRARGRAPRPGGRHQFPRDREVRPPAGTLGERPQRLRLGDGRLQQVLQLLRGALHARRGGQRPLDDVLAEIAHLAGQGVREVNLLGQNVNAYRGRNHLGEITDFAELLHLVAAVQGIGRIRYTTSHPLEFSDALVQAYADIPQLVSHVHLPVQSGSDRILAAMKRNHTALEYKSIIRKLRRMRPDISISSDFIVGFPGETEKDFEDTMRLIADVGFDHSFSFVYSARPGTPAAELPTTRRRSSRSSASRCCRRASTSRPSRSAAAWSGASSVYWSPRCRNATRAACRAAPGTTGSRISPATTRA